MPASLALDQRQVLSGATEGAGLLLGDLQEAAAKAGDNRDMTVATER